MNTCPCCSGQLLRHIRQSSIYWLCPRCKQEMPVLERTNTNLRAKNTITPLRKVLSSDQVWMTIK